MFEDYIYVLKYYHTVIEKTNKWTTLWFFNMDTINDYKNI